nr:hypothetical protein CFP56_25805 [Quercus suber]
MRLWLIWKHFDEMACAARDATLRERCVKNRSGTLVSLSLIAGHAIQKRRIPGPGCGRPCCACACTYLRQASVGGTLDRRSCYKRAQARDALDRLLSLGITLPHWRVLQSLVSTCDVGMFLAIRNGRARLSGFCSLTSRLAGAVVGVGERRDRAADEVGHNSRVGSGSSGELEFDGDTSKGQATVDSGYAEGQSNVEIEVTELTEEVRCVPGPRAPGPRQMVQATVSSALRHAG